MPVQSCEKYTATLSEILAITPAVQTVADATDVPGVRLEWMKTTENPTGKWYGDLGTMSKATADALYASGALANLATGATYRDTSGTQYTYSAGAGWVAVGELILTNLVPGTGVSQSIKDGNAAILAEACSQARMVIIPAGDYESSAFESKAVIRGSGRGGLDGNAPTRLIYTENTGNFITMTGPGGGLSDIAVVCTGDNPTSSTGIYATFSGSIFAGDGFFASRLKLHGWYNGAEFNQGRYTNWTDCYVFDTKNYGIYFKNREPLQADFGDHSVQGCTFCSLTTSRIGVSAVRWESGGGLRFINNKTNGNYNTLGQSWNAGLSVAVADGISTSVLVVTGNSFEGIEAGGAPVVVTQVGAGTGNFSKCVITSNEALAGGGIRVVGIQAGRLSNIYIGQNVLTGMSIGVYIKNASAFVIAKNQIMGLNTDSACVEVSTGCHDYDIEAQSSDTYRVAMLRDDSAVSGATKKTGTNAFYNGNLPATASDATDTVLYSVQMNAYTVSEIHVHISGNVAGAGSFIHSGRYALLQGAANTKPALVSIGTPVNSGASVVVTIDATTSNQTGYVKIKRSAGVGTQINGTVNIAVSGQPSRVWRGV